ncbi:MAG TPA: SDR family NAD(P)-dependent oxidoreductase, partial [Saprospiraceae bacterium]|nr:SDR family NAD(P)-dependent oxidoreductase [Saprospiraceae bacterium]
CSRGIGKRIAIGLAKAGAHIIGVSSSALSADNTLLEEINETGRKFVHYQADFSDRSAIYQLIDKVKADGHIVDILINNAGTIRRAEVAKHSDEDWDYVMRTNLDSAFIITREFGKDMITRKSGKIVFIASLLSFQGGITVPGYAASKGAVASLIKAFANEWAQHGVNVNGIAPGYIATDNTEALRQNVERSSQIMARIPQQRWGLAEDLIGPSIFLASAASNYVNGEILVVDGGWMGR